MMDAGGGGQCLTVIDNLNLQHFLAFNFFDTRMNNSTILFMLVLLVSFLSNPSEIHFKQNVLGLEETSWPHPFDSIVSWAAKHLGLFQRTGSWNQ